MKHSKDDCIKISYKCANLKLVKDVYSLVKLFTTGH